MIRALLFCSCLTAFAADYDLVIRNARIVDGSGNPWFRGDVAIRAGRIAAVGRVAGTAERTVDAAHRVVAPGFIDVHTHSEGGIEKVPTADNYVLDGVTTIVTGNCGSSSIDLAAWFTQLEKDGIGINLASLVGHNSVRDEIMAHENRQATPDELRRMQTVIEKAMRDGAVGFSTGLIYLPGTYADTSEVVALAKAAAKYGGVYASHMRNEGERVLEAIEEAVTVGREAGMPVQLSHFKIDNKRLWGASTKSLALVEKFRSEGVEVMVDQYPYDRSSTGLQVLAPSWAFAGGTAEFGKRLADPQTHKRIVAEMLVRLKGLGHENFQYAMVARFRSKPEYEGKTISDINRMMGRPATAESEAETILEMLSRWGGAQMIYHSMGDEDVERIMRYPNTAIASDGGVRVFGEGMPHPRGYATNARVLAEYVRKRGILTLEDAIRRMTSLPAQTFRFRDRGLLREGFAADLVVFDPAKVEDKSTYTNPHQYSAGFDFVVVNGSIVAENGKITGTRSGRILRGPGAPANERRPR